MAKAEVSETLHDLKNVVMMLEGARFRILMECTCGEGRKAAGDLRRLVEKGQHLVFQLVDQLYDDQGVLLIRERGKEPE